MKFSANLGFLWQELSLADAVRAASEAGFDAVEFHWPYDTPSEELAVAIKEHSLEVCALNTKRGAEGEFGLSALAGRKSEALAVFDEAIIYGKALGALYIHAMAGITDESSAMEVLAEFLTEAAPRAEAADIGILIEPINNYDVAGYCFSDFDVAEGLAKKTGVALMYDCYHAGKMGRDILADLERFMPYIGHVQIASLSDRGEPDELYYGEVLSALDRHGYQGYIGAEYKPRASTAEGLGWLEELRK